MAKGYDTHQQRKNSLSLLGKDLARRAKSRCELTGENGIALNIYEIPPVDADPNINRCLLISESVREQLERPKSIIPDSWRGLTELIWSELPAQQIMAHRILSYLAKSHPWAQDIIDNAFLDEAVIEESNKSPLGF